MKVRIVARFAFELFLKIIDFALLIFNGLGQNDLRFLRN